MMALTKVIRGFLFTLSVLFVLDRAHGAGKIACFYNGKAFWRKGKKIIRLNCVYLRVNCTIAEMKSLTLRRERFENLLKNIPVGP